MESGTYCSRCGALLIKDAGDGETTQTFTVEELSEHAHDPAEGLEGPALLVRAGGGLTGDSFGLILERTRIGRRPESEVFLDDVTVSRDHAVVVRRDGGFFAEDEGSLNGTFVNRRRIESKRLENGDEVQIGKYRLLFVER